MPNSATTKDVAWEPFFQVGIEPNIVAYFLR